MTVMFLIDQIQVGPGALGIAGIQIIFRPFLASVFRDLDNENPPLSLRDIPVQDSVFHIV